MTRRAVVVMVAVATGVAAVAAVLGLRLLLAGGGNSAVPASAGQRAIAPGTARAPGPQAGLKKAGCSGGRVGVATDNLGQFEAATRIYPSVAVKYLAWGSSFPAGTIQQNHGIGVTTQLVLKPENVTLQSIVNGSADSFLADWAIADRHLGLPVILSFAPEANGGWYSWGKGHVSAALYKEAWRHVHDALARYGARKLDWLWQVNVIFTGSQPLSELWPGTAYVNEVGIDGQLRRGQTFSSVFGPTIRQVRAITKRPVSISEVAVDRGPYRVRQINELFAAVCGDRLVGFVWFDVSAPDINFELEGDREALAAFRRDVAMRGRAPR